MAAATRVQVRHATTAQNAAFTGAAGEVVYDNQAKRLVVHDGATAGGFGFIKIAGDSGIGILNFGSGGTFLTLDGSPGGVNYVSGSDAALSQLFGLGARLNWGVLSIYGDHAFSRVGEIFFRDRQGTNPATDGMSNNTDWLGAGLYEWHLDHTDNNVGVRLLSANLSTVSCNAAFSAGGGTFAVSAIGTTNINNAIFLNSDGSASFASNATFFDAFGDLSIGGGSLLLNVDGSATFAVGLLTVDSAGNMTNGGNQINADGSCFFAGFNVGIDPSGNITCPNTGAFQLLQDGSCFFSSGSLAIDTAGNITQAAGSFLKMTAGANARAGNLTLVGGTQTVANTTVTANTVIMLTRKTNGGTPVFDVTYTIIAGTSFTVTASSALDTSTFSYLLIET